MGCADLEGEGNVGAVGVGREEEVETWRDGKTVLTPTSD